MTIAPTNPQFPERARQTYDKIEATPRRNELGERSGSRHAEEGLAYMGGAYSAPFYGSVSASDRGSNHAAYEVQQAGQANGRGSLGSGQQVPAWDGVPNESLGGFAAGTSGDAGQAYPFPHQPRPGFNRSTITDVSGLNLGERQNTRIVHQIAPVNGGRGRRNIADVSDR